MKVKWITLSLSLLLSLSLSLTHAHLSSFTSSRKHLAAAGWRERNRWREEKVSRRNSTTVCRSVSDKVSVTASRGTGIW